jgi:methionyl-tRNA formyltransferase
LAIEEHQPHLVIVSGTNLVGTRTIAAAAGARGILNLHTGISPYVKGGPNCTNWCLAEGAFHLIGNTIMWLDIGIDSGAIVATEQTPLTGGETLSELHWKVMEHGHDLYVRTVRQIARGEEVPFVPQSSVGEGRTFYAVEWNARRIVQALRNFRRYYSPAWFTSKEHQARSTEIQLFPLDERGKG